MTINDTTRFAKELAKNLGYDYYTNIVRKGGFGYTEAFTGTPVAVKPKWGKHKNSVVYLNILEDSITIYTSSKDALTAERQTAIHTEKYHSKTAVMMQIAVALTTLF